MLIFPCYFGSDDGTLTCARCRPFGEGSGEERSEETRQNKLLDAASDTNSAEGTDGNDIVREMYVAKQKFKKRKKTVVLSVQN